MCTTCGCSTGAEPRLTDLSAEGEPSEHIHEPEEHGPPRPHHHGEHDRPHSHHHGEEHLHQTSAHEHEHLHHHPRVDEGAPDQETRSTSRTLLLEQELLAKNNQLAERNRGWFEGRQIAAFNLTSSPGAGKTTLLEQTIRVLGGEIPISVIEGDQETVRDAERIRATGCRVIQINTGTGCHLDASMLANSLRALNPSIGSLVMIENVGNLVCPALFDLGERAKVVIMSVTEGEDKPLKYPHMFRASELMILNKIDLLPHVQFDVDHCLRYARQVNPKLQILQLSATRGDGLDAWCAWLRAQMQGRARAEEAPC